MSHFYLIDADSYINIELIANFHIEGEKTIVISYSGIEAPVKYQYKSKTARTMAMTKLTNFIRATQKTVQ